MTGEEEVKLFNDLGADLHDLIARHVYDADELLDEEKFEIALKSLMFFTMKTVYDQAIPLQMMLSYVRGIYQDLSQISERRDARAETIADIAKQ